MLLAFIDLQLIYEPLNSVIRLIDAYFYLCNNWINESLKMEGKDNAIKPETVW